jgi:hypothetical protein
MHNSSSTKKFLTKYPIHIWPEDDDEDDGDVFKVHGIACAFAFAEMNHQEQAPYTQTH